MRRRFFPVFRQMIQLTLTFLVVAVLGDITRAALPNVDELFRDLKSQAAEHSTDVQIAQASLHQRSAQQYTAFARWLPRLDLQISRSQSLDYSFATSGAFGNFGAAFTPQETPLSRWSLNLSFPLYRRTVHTAYLEASAQKSLAEIQLEAKLTELDWRMRSHLGAYLLSAYRVATLESSIELAKTNLREARLRFELGQKTKIDVLKSEANLLSLESKRISYDQQKNSDLRTFLEFTGLGAKTFQNEPWGELLKNEKSVSSALDDFTQIQNASQLLAPYLNDEGEKRIEETIPRSSANYHAYLAQEEVSQAQVKNLLAQEYPELLIQGSLNKQGPQFADAFSPDQISHAISIVLNVPIFTGGALISSYNEKKNAEHVSELQRERDVIHFKNEVMNEVLQIRAFLKTIESQKTSAAQNEEIVRLSLKSYELGKINILELLTSQNELIEAKIGLAKTKVDLSSLMHQLAWNLGVPL